MDYRFKTCLFGCLFFVFSPALLSQTVHDKNLQSTEVELEITSSERVDSNARLLLVDGRRASLIIYDEESGNAKFKLDLVSKKKIHRELKEKIGELAMSYYKYQDADWKLQSNALISNRFDTEGSVIISSDENRLSIKAILRDKGSLSSNLVIQQSCTSNKLENLTNSSVMNRKCCSKRCADRTNRTMRCCGAVWCCACNTCCSPDSNALPDPG